MESQIHPLFQGSIQKAPAFIAPRAKVRYLRSQYHRPYSLQRTLIKSVLPLLVIFATLCRTIVMVGAQSTGQHCEDVSFLPAEIQRTFARDGSGALDIHTFNRFFTYQVTSSSTAVVQTRIDPRNHTREDGVDVRTIQEDPGEMIFRLRASLRSPNMDQTQQSMRVTLLEEETGRVLAEGSTEDHDERSVHLDSISLTPSHAYTLKYEFYIKNSATDDDEQSISSAHMGASSCSRPFVVSELAVTSKKLLLQRAEAYKSSQRGSASLPEKEIGQLNCDFSILDNTSQDLQHGERGLYCDRQAFTYSLAGQSPQELNQIFSKEFTIAGAEDESVTYLFDMTIGYDFATSAQLKAILQRIDVGQGSQKFIYDPLACLYDHSCIETELVNKNEIGIDVILTEGKYKLTIFDQEENAVRRWLTHDNGLSEVPFSFELQAVPVVQNEEHVMCGDKLFLEESFIQRRFIDHRGGERFVFDDFILLSLVNTTQTIEFSPEADMLLKVSSKLAYGINMKLNLHHGREMGSIKSQRIGNTETLFATVKQGQTYRLELDFSNSIITLTSFFDCPHAHLQIAMVREADARSIIKKQHEKPHDFVVKETRAVREKLSSMFNLISMQRGQKLGQPEDLVGDGTLFNHEAHYSPGQTASSSVVTYHDFSIQAGEPHHIHIEIFYEPQFYELEILIVSKDAGETQIYHDRRASAPDITLYKGSKEICADLESGDYTFKIVSRLPGTDKATEDFIPRFFEFQMFAVAGEAAPHQQIRPLTLNYLGLLGLRGENFGSFVHLLRDVEIAAQEVVEIQFLLSGAKNAKSQGPSIDVQVVEIDGDGDQLDLSLVKVPKKKASDEPDYLYIQDDEDKPHSERFMDSYEAGITYESLVAQDLAKDTKYRVIVKNRDSSGSTTVTIKLTITEHTESGKTGFLSGHPAEVVPRSFEEVTRIKPKVPGLKESSFIQGSRAVMEAFKVSSLVPFIPKSQKVYQGNFATGARSQDRFVQPLDFQIDEESALIFAQVKEYSGREDLFLTVYSLDGRVQEEVARSSLGKYSNALGPATLTKGKYRLIIHPDQDSKTLIEGSELIRFGLDVLLEKSSVGGAKDFDLVVEEVELCSLPALPNSFNGPGFLHPLSGNIMEAAGNYRLSELLEGTTIRFEVHEASTMIFYLGLPEGVHGEAELERVKGVHTTRVFSEDLNKGDETFLRRQGGFQHRAIIQIREFLDTGSYMIKIQGRDATPGSQRVMPRCEAYQLALSIAPLASDAPVFSTDEDCLDSQFLPEHLAFDEVKEGNLTYPVSTNTVDVAYLDLKNNGEGPFMFFFQIQYDPRILGVLALSLSKYDQDTSTFEQAALYRTPQDGTTQILTVVQSGTYAIGIQTLTSTPRMHVSSGLSGEQQALLGTRLLHETCFGVHYSYLVASTKKGDSRALQGGPLGLIGLLFGGGLGKIAQQVERDGMLLDELGNIEWLGNCPHDDLPSQLPVSESGFDKALRLRVQEKPADFLDIVVDRESLLRITIHSSNSRNQVRAYLYQDSSTTSALAWTSGSRSVSTLLYPLTGQQMAYKLKIEYESLDQADPCPTFELRIIVKALEDVINENLRCHASPLLPPSISIHSDDFVWSGSFSFTSDYVKKAIGGRNSNFEYDLLLEWPTADAKASYYLDIEAESDFLSGQVEFKLFYEGKDRNLRLLGRSHPLPSAVGGGNLIERLKLLDREEDLADDVHLTGAVLRVSLPSEAVELLSILETRGHLKRGQEELCHNFQLSIRAELRGKGQNSTLALDNGQARLVRVRWEGERVADGIFDARTRLVAALEFDRSLSGAYQLLKTSEWAGLVQEVSTLTTENQTQNRFLTHVVNPTVKTLAPGDSSTVLIQFAAGSIARGACHKLTLHSPRGAFGPVTAVPNFEESIIGKDLQVCTTSCLCDWVGTSSCREETNQCICRANHVGSDCSQCASGFTRDPDTGECRPSSKCKELGGQEDCHGHGVCQQKGQTAVCSCKMGFSNDGFLQCARCTDPLFKFPDCSSRAWILEEPDVNCRDLSWEMPENLSAFSGKGQELQNEGGSLNWAHKYKLTEGSQLRHASAHTFVVSTTSVLRLFVDTVGSGVLVKYRLLDDKLEEVLSSADYVGDADADGYVGTGSEITLVHQPEEGLPADSPFTLHLEYKHEAGTYEQPMEEDDCPLIDIRLIVEPLITAQSALACTSQELAIANQPRTVGWEFGRSTRFESQKVVIQNADQSLFEHDGHESSTFAILRYELIVHDQGNALSVVATYPFSSVAMSMALIEKKTGEVVELELTSSLEGEKNQAPNLSNENDMASYIEVPALDAGTYVLEIALQRSLFLPTKQHSTCLSFDLVVEYIVRQQKSQDKYEILSVRPLSLNSIRNFEEKVIEVDFDRPIVLDDLVSGLADRLKVCTLKSQDDGSTIHPKSARVERKGKTLRLDFEFQKASSSTQRRCYSLMCSSQETNSLGRELIVPMQEETRYCIESDSELANEAVSICNPHALPKLDQNKPQNCICAAPYTGPDCQKCEVGFKPSQQNSDKNGNKKNTICIIDQDHVTTVICNSHGRAQSNGRFTSIKEITCQCDQGYGGKHCDYCQDATRAYPDCTTEISSSIYDSSAAHAFLARRRYNEHGYSTAAAHYFSEGELEPTVFNEECGWVDYPDNFDRLEFMREFNGGEFHIADLYVVNHSQDNIIKFKPRSAGIFKMLVQQPEAEEVLAGSSEAAFDLEIGLYDPEQKKFLRSGMNQKMILPGHRAIKLEYAQLSFEITEEKVGKAFYVFFRALNFTDDKGEGHAQSEGCLALYLEAEFSSHTDRARYCSNDPKLEPSANVESLKDSHPLADAFASGRAKIQGNGHSQFSIADQSSSFFTYKDYYVPDLGVRTNKGADHEVTISLQQKFIEENTLDFVVEILDTDVEFNEISRETHPPQLHAAYDTRAQSGLMSRHFSGNEGNDIVGALGPSCKGLCLIGGEKAFNEMQRVLELSPKTYFRIWFLQQTPDGKSTSPCANFQIYVSAAPIRSSGKQSSLLNGILRCFHEELPVSLNIPRYLTGLDGQQKDFHYRSMFRVDHLQHNQGHIIQFNLSQPTILRILAPVHKHLDFQLILNEEHGPYNHKTLIKAKQEDHHSTIFAQLDSGAYHIKIAFMSDSAVLQLPCQTIQLELAMMTVDSGKQMQQKMKDDHHTQAKRDFSLSELLINSPQGPMTLFRPFAFGWRHISAGMPPYLDTDSLFVEVFRESFEVAEDDDAGLIIDVNSDFLLSNVNFAINNVLTGQVVEDERRESSGKVVIEHLVPGPYELILYTHECVTNMDPAQTKAISSFDLLVQMSIRLLRVTRRLEGANSNVPVDILDFSKDSQSQDQSLNVQKKSQALPLLSTHEEFLCIKNYLPLPNSLDLYQDIGILDIHEEYYIPTQAFYSHEVKFTVKQGQDAIRVFMAKANSKMAILEDKSRNLVAESKSQEGGDSQLVIATHLRIGSTYVLLLEFSEEPVSLDGASSQQCDHFFMAFSTSDSSTICSTAISDEGHSAIVITADSGSQNFTTSIQQKFLKKELRIEGSGTVDILVTVDHSDAFYRAELSIKAILVVPSEPERSQIGTDGVAFEEMTLIRSPQYTDYSRKHSTSYYFADVPQGQYVMKLRQRFKSKGCAESIFFTIQSWKTSSSQTNLAQHGHGSLNLYQSQAEEQERPRISTKLPIDLRSYKYQGGNPSFMTQKENQSYLLFSGPIQLSEMETQNTITFNIPLNDTRVRFYVEHSDLSFTLRDISEKHARVVSQSPAGSSMVRQMSSGTYRMQLSHATSHARKNAAILPPRTQLTISIADPEMIAYHSQSWPALSQNCDGEANFPLALNQKKQTDLHQLYYNAALIKVSPHILQTKQVVQTYNFRVNVTSRMYFEVGMHLLSSQLTLQLNALNERGYSIQGKQRANLNVLDVQVGPGDYSVALKQPSLSGAHLIHDCGAYSLQGLIEPINLMSASQNTGEILQRGIAECSVGADGDVLPSKIYGSKAHTRGGGELHVDAEGHFMKRFRNVVQKLSHGNSETTPEFDRIEIEVVEDAWLQLSILYEAFGANDVMVVLSDTLMLGQTIRASSEFTLRDLDTNRNEMIVKFKLDKGRHYALTIYYVGSPKSGMRGITECSLYDLTLSISHNVGLLHETRCPSDQNTKSWNQGLPKRISENDLDRNGFYNFEQVLKLDYPNDFSHLEKINERVNQKTVQMDVLRSLIPVELSSNFDIEATIEFEFDQGLFTIELIELGKDEEGILIAEQSNRQQSLDFQGNDDRQRTVRRAIVASDVPSNAKHVLSIANRQPDMLHLINPDTASDACMYVKLKIQIQSSKRSTQNLYKQQRSPYHNSPSILRCEPHDSPTFIHDRQREVAFAMVFSERPFIRGIDINQQTENDIWHAIRIKAVLVSTPGGLQSTIFITPSEILASQKEYAQEYHITAKFDVSEYERSQTEKILFVQLVIHQEQLVDQQQRLYQLDKKLEARGLPIYVFEKGDQAQLFAEEGSDVTITTAGTDIGEVGLHQQASGRMTKLSELEEYTLQKINDETPDQLKSQREKQEAKMRKNPKAPIKIHDQPIINSDEVKNSNEINQNSQDLGHFTNVEPITENLLNKDLNNATSGDDNKHFSMTALLVLGLVVGVFYALGQLGVRIPVPWGSPASGQVRYGQLRRDAAADSDGEDDRDDPAARRRMLELSTFEPEKGGPRNRRAKGNALASISAEETQSSQNRENLQKTGLPMTNIDTLKKKEGNYKPQLGGNIQTERGQDNTAQQLQRELELFAQDDDEEASSLIKTDNQMDGNYFNYQQQSRENLPDSQYQNSQEDDEAELQEYEQYFEQNR